MNDGHLSDRIRQHDHHGDNDNDNDNDEMVDDHTKHAEAGYVAADNSSNGSRDMIENAHAMEAKIGYGDHGEAARAEYDDRDDPNVYHEVRLHDGIHPCRTHANLS